MVWSAIIIKLKNKSLEHYHSLYSYKYLTEVTIAVWNLSYSITLLDGMSTWHIKWEFCLIREQNTGEYINQSSPLTLPKYEIIEQEAKYY